MSDTYVEAIPRAESLPPAQLRPRAWTRWLKWGLLLLICFWIASEGLSLAIQHTRLRKILTARIETAFGRPVEVGSYDFSLWDGPALEANSVTVGEDPRFGQEYFLRAESMTVSLRWGSLLRGHLQLGTLSLNRPSLNLVRDAGGDWNLAEWLPQPSGSVSPRAPVGPLLPFSPLRFSRIEVDGGRINFKNGDDKLPLAFVGVTGAVETDAPGRWRISLEATPWRAAVVVQQAGTIHLSGDLGGTSSRLRPAALDVSWTDASISDVLRLAGRDDVGIRGGLAMAIVARTRDQGEAWAIQGRAELRQVHRWNLALRPDSPSVNVVARMNWNPSAPGIELADVALEAPHSTAHASGWIRWKVAGTPASEKSPPVQLTLSSSLDVSDLLPWLRAFQPGVAEGISVRGRVEVKADVGEDDRAGFAAWPPQLVSAGISSDGIDLATPNLRRPVHLGPLEFHYDRGLVSLLPVSLAFGSPGSALQFESSVKPGRRPANAMRISGNVSDVRDVLAAAAAMGWNVAKGWDISGPVHADLRWQGDEYPWQAPPVGFINWGAGPGVAVLRAPFLNLPIGDINATTEWKPGVRHITLQSAQAFGARWSGALDSRDPTGNWQFTLAADHLAAAELDRWLNPAWRESFLGRMLPFLNSRSPSGAAPENLRASGRLTLDQFTLAPLVVRHLQGDLKIDGRHIVLANATGQFYGGQVAGSLVATLSGTPAYHADLAFSRVGVPSLTAATPSLAGLRAESAAGEISIDARGSSRADLVASFTCQGSARATPILLDSDWRESPAGQSPGPGPVRFYGGSASFSCANRRVDFQSLSLLTGIDTSASGAGTIDFSRNLDLRLQMHSALPRGESSSGRMFRITGSLAAPTVVPAQPPLRRSR
jgi:hypothetical protein